MGDAHVHIRPMGGAVGVRKPEGRCALASDLDPGRVRYALKTFGDG
jgi:hypothetical protein